MSSSDATRITLHAAGISLPESVIYFAFPSGRWTFDCVSCGAQCCRGHGYSMSLAVDAAHHWIGAEPLRFFASPGDKANLTVSNFKPSCFKLTETGLCQVQLDHGFQSKPETCRLFPFNSLKIVGEYLIVEPHPHLCPLAVASSSSSLSAHGGLLASMQMQGIYQEIERVHDPDQEIGAVLALEREIRDLQHDANATIESFVASQIALTAKAFGLGSPRTQAEALDSVMRFKPHLETLLGCSPARERKSSETEATLWAATATLRSQLQFLPIKSAKPALALPPVRIPRFILALHSLLALAAEAGMKSLTYQTVMGIAREYPVLLRFCAWSDEPMAWRASRGQITRRKGESRDAFKRYVEAARMLGSNDSSLVLGDVLSKCCGEEPLGRLNRLERLCRRLASSIVPRSEAGKGRPSLGGWLLRNASEEALWKFASARQSSAKR